jgi:hypothetical protein
MRFPGRLIALLFLMLPAAATAAPFCVETQAIPRQCIYFDAASCNQRARQMGGYCSANESEVHATAGLGHYCLLTSSEVSMCIYTDRSECDREAAHQHGVCVQATTLPESPGADPYRDIRPSMAGY